MLAQSQQRVTPRGRGVAPKEPKKKPEDVEMQKPPEKLAKGSKWKPAALKKPVIPTKP